MKIEHIGDYGLISGVGEGVVHGLPPVMAYRTPFGIRVELEEPIRKKPQLVDYDRYLHIADAEDWWTVKSATPDTYYAEQGLAAMAVSGGTYDPGPPVSYQGPTSTAVNAIVLLQEHVGTPNPIERLVFNLGKGDGVGTDGFYHTLNCSWNIENESTAAICTLKIRAITGGGTEMGGAITRNFTAEGYTEEGQTVVFKNAGDDFEADDVGRTLTVTGVGDMEIIEFGTTEWVVVDGDPWTGEKACSVTDEGGLTWNTCYDTEGEDPLTFADGTIELQIYFWGDGEMDAGLGQYGDFRTGLPGIDRDSSHIPAAWHSANIKGFEFSVDVTYPPGAEGEIYGHDIDISSEIAFDLGDAYDAYIIRPE